MTQPTVSKHWRKVCVCTKIWKITDDDDDDDDDDVLWFNVHLEAG